MVVVLLVPWPAHEDALMSRNEESTPISSLKVKFSPACLFSCKSSSLPQQEPSPHSAFPPSVRAFPGEGKTLVLL